MLAAGVLIFNEEGQILLIKHRWRRAWEYPAGAADGAESPLEAAKRETREEVGLSPHDFRLLGVDFLDAKAPNGTLFFTFSAKVSADQLVRLKIDPFEATDHCWATPIEAQELISGRLQGRFRELLQAHASGTTVYSHSGNSAN